MFGSSMLDIAIGVVFIFLLLSIFATAINEIILSTLNMRGKELLRGIQTLLNDKTPDGLVARVYSNGQIYGLFDGPLDLDKQSNLPSYIPARNFALALLDCIEPTPDPNQPPPDPTAVDPALQNIVAISQGFKNEAAALAANPATEKIGKPLISMIAMAGNDRRKLQTAVEDYFNSGMDRVSGWYKYRTQQLLFVIGLIMAIALNAGTIDIVRQLSKDPTLRQSIVAAAQSAKPLPAPPPPQPGQPAPTSPLQQQVADATASFARMTDLGIPLGWPHGAPTAAGLIKHPFTASSWQAALAWPTHGANWESVLGWLLTAIAVSLGAPFWFDSLNKIMVIRSTVKPQEKSPDEPSKS